LIAQGLFRNSLTLHGFIGTVFRRNAHSGFATTRDEKGNQGGI
jgi:hypothetical protein